MSPTRKNTVIKTASNAVARPAADNVDPAVSRFLDGAWMERGLSANTLAAYRADLMALSRWLGARGTQITKATRADLLGFIAWRVESGARPRSTARQLSSFRRFYRHLLREGSLQDDPTAQIAMPKIGRSLPKSLTEEEVESLLNAPVVSDPLGARDRTMLEVLYATGLRVSELVSLKYSQLNLNQGVLRVHRQGRSRAAHPAGRGSRALAARVHRHRSRRDPARPHHRLSLPDAPRRPHDAPGLLAHHQALRAQGERARRSSRRTRCGMPSPRTC